MEKEIIDMTGKMPTIEDGAMANLYEFSKGDLVSCPKCEGVHELRGAAGENDRMLGFDCPKAPGETLIFGLDKDLLTKDRETKAINK